MKLVKIQSPIFKICQISIVAGLLTSLASCNGALFKGSSKGGGSAPAPVTTPTPSTSPDSPTAAPICQDGQEAVGANVTFMIDNSSSNSATDCPSPTQVGTSGGVSLMQCGAETNREKAVLAAFDALAEVAKKDTREAAVSNVSVVQFPGSVSSGSSKVETSAKTITNGWLRTPPLDTNRATLAEAMKFTRSPFGSTPIGSAIGTGVSLYSQVPNDGRARVVVLVTDGEPTDSDPVAVSEKAEQLRANGVEVITVFITNGQTRSQRETVHSQMLASWEQIYQKSQTHYYASRYTSFDDYLNNLLGRQGRTSLIQSVTSQKDVKCVDKIGSVCERFLVEVADASALTKAFNEIVRTKVIKCQ